jgi:hypothetical protein
MKMSKALVEILIWCFHAGGIRISARAFLRLHKSKDVSDHFIRQAKGRPVQSPCQGQGKCRLLFDFTFGIDTLDKDFTTSAIGGLSGRMVECIHYYFREIETSNKE